MPAEGPLIARSSPAHGPLVARNDILKNGLYLHVVSNDSKIAENGDHHAEIWTHFDRVIYFLFIVYYLLSVIYITETIYHHPLPNGDQYKPVLLVNAYHLGSGT